MSDTPRTDTNCVNCGYDIDRHSRKDSACPVYDMMDSYFHPTLKWKADGKPTMEMDERDDRIATLERKLAEQAPLIAKAIRDLEAGAIELRTARNEILRADTEARRAQRHVEILLHERDRARARFDRLFAVLMSIHNLLAPAPFENEGKTYVFKLELDSPLWMDAYQRLCDRIRAIPEEIAKAEEPQK